LPIVDRLVLSVGVHGDTYANQGMTKVTISVVGAFLEK
jgi:hypothetical protein